jgi:hypothetical protein
MIPKRYVPNSLSKKDKQQQMKMILKSRKLYKKGKYFTRKKVDYPHTTSKHIINARKLYNIETIRPTKELALKTGCSIQALEQIVKKGEGAYYSSGSRPNQTPQSWGFARLASSITAGKASLVDYNILENGCDHNKMAYKLASELKNKK